MPIELYRSIEPTLLEMEKKRKRQARLALPLLIAALASGLLSLVAFADVLFPFWLRDHRALVLFAAAMVLAFVLGYRYASIDQQYRRRSRRRLLSEIFERMDCEVKPDCRSNITADDLQATRLLAHFDRAETDCVAEAVHERTPVRLFYVHTEYIYDTFTSKGRTRNKYRTLFRGTLLLAHPRQQYPLTLVVEPTTKGGGLMNQAVNLNQQAGLEYIRLQRPDLAEHLAVYADHPQMARRLLSENLLHQMRELQDELDTSVRFSYIGSVLCLAIGDEEQDHKLDIGLRDSLLDSKRVVHLAEELAFGLELIRAFDTAFREVSG